MIRHAGSGCLHELFALQVARDPDAIAVTGAGGEQLTYGQLDRRATLLAARLRELGAGPERLVALRVERSATLVVGVLGILKAGAAYLPIDVGYPEARQTFMLQDSGAALLVTTSDLPLPPGVLPGQVVYADRDQAEVISGDRPADANADNLAYVIYTSGSSGTPKGVQVTHRNVTWLMAATLPWSGFGPGDVVTLYHSIAFDFSVWEMWSALLFGGRLVVVPHAVARNPRDLLTLLQREKVSVLNQTPSAFLQLMEADGETGVQLPALRSVLIAGETLVPATLVPWWTRHGDTSPRLANAYGITETTVLSTIRPLSLADAGAVSVIGRAIPGLRLEVLTESGAAAAPGEPGELVVAGPGVTRGYLNRPELTAERFVPDPGHPGARRYRSGDLVRYLPDGDLEYLGRIDAQVKIRGFRIELGEIETTLVTHSAVREAVVVVRDAAGGGRRLIGYVVPQRESSVSAAELRQHLAERLPEHMIPAVIVSVTEFPLTPNGKVDRKRLPAPDGEQPAGPFQEPATDLERRIAATFRELLELGQVGRAGHFFDLGGDSLLAIRALNKLRAELGGDLPLRALFDAPTVAGLAELLSSRTSGASVDATVTSEIPAIPRDRGVRRRASPE